MLLHVMLLYMPVGYEGSRCEKDLNECLTDNPCAAGSTCNNTIGDYICHCPYGKLPFSLHC